MIDHTSTRCYLISIFKVNGRAIALFVEDLLLSDQMLFCYRRFQPYFHKQTDK